MLSIFNLYRSDKIPDEDIYANMEPGRSIKLSGL